MLYNNALTRLACTTSQNTGNIAKIWAKYGRFLPKCPYIRACSYKYGRLLHIGIDLNLIESELIGRKQKLKAVDENQWSAKLTQLVKVN